MCRCQRGLAALGAQLDLGGAVGGIAIASQLPLPFACPIEASQLPRGREHAAPLMAGAAMLVDALGAQSMYHWGTLSVGS